MGFKVFRLHGMYIKSVLGAPLLHPYNHVGPDVPLRGIHKPSIRAKKDRACVQKMCRGYTSLGRLAGDLGVGSQKDSRLWGAWGLPSRQLTV